MASELKPCPFCQYKAHEWIQGNKKMACCDNMDCPCRAIVCTVEQWNTRPAPAATDTGLDYYTAADVMWSLEGIDPVPSKNGQWVKRSQAEELLADERHERDMLKADFNDINAERQRWRDRAEKAEADNAAKVEQERLRFEGDLDKWMKIIGAGITGYQPEAYALMDLACHELVKLRSDISAIAGHVDCEADSDSILHIIRDLEADNAALAARVKELEAERDTADKTLYEQVMTSNESLVALEAKLAAAEKALEPFADHANDRAVDDTGWRDKETVKIVVSIGDLRKARAVLGGKPS